MKIVVGSRNPVKITATELAFKNYWPDAVVVGVDVKSGVAEQPMTEEETMRGAEQRARHALTSDPQADYGVGLEGGVTRIGGHDSRLFECAWAAIVDRNGTLGIGGGLYFELPRQVAEKIEAGGELGPVMDSLTGTMNVKQNMGAIGVFTQGRLDRTQAYVHLLLSALIKFVSPEWFI